MERETTMTIKNLVFDVNGVLFSFNPIKLFIETRMNPVNVIWLIKAGRSKQFRDLNKGLYQSKKDMIEKCPDAFPASEKRAWKVFSTRWNECFYPNKKTVELMKELSNKYNVYILSNVDPDEKANILKTDFFKVARGSVFSCDVGCMKPEADIFRIFLEKYQLKPEECLFIDDKAYNTRAAEKLGFETVTFLTYRQGEKQIRNKLKKG